MWIQFSSEFDTDRTYRFFKMYFFFRYPIYIFILWMENKSLDFHRRKKSYRVAIMVS